MGFEVRRVPENWEHPRCKDGHHQPLHDHSFKDATREWKQKYLAWDSGERPDNFANIYDKDTEFWEYHGPPPERDDCRPHWSESERTHYQLYETVSEGTPVSPTAPSLNWLARWLSDTKFIWGAMGNPINYDGWMRVLEAGSVPSMMSGPGIGIKSGAEYVAGNP